MTNYSPMMIDIVALRPWHRKQRIRARTSRIVRLTLSQHEPKDSSQDDQKRTADGDHVFEKGDRKIVPSDRF